MVIKKTEKLKGKRIALCVTGSIAAILSPLIARELRRHSAEVIAYMTKSSQKILHPYSLQFATGKEVVTEITGKVEHLEEYDAILIAPCTFSTLSKIVNGIPDNAVTALVLSSNPKKVLVALAMHKEMYENVVFKNILEKALNIGYEIIEPRIEESSAKMAGVEEIVDYTIRKCYDKKDFRDKRILITMGATLEYIDPIRVITNLSSGKTGLALAREAFYRGAYVRIIHGLLRIEIPRYFDRIQVNTSEEMLNEVLKNIDEFDIFISVAAVTDFKPEFNEEKLPSGREYVLKLIPTRKILEEIKNRNIFKIGFKAVYKKDYEEIVRLSREMMKKYNLEMVVANDVSKGIIGSDETEVIVVTKDEVFEISRDKKILVAERIFDIISKYLRK